MATLQSVAELAWRQVFPNPNDEVSITKEEFIETAKLEYAYRVWEMNRLERRETGENNVPPNLLSEATIIVENKEADISSIKALRSLPNNTWIQSLGDFDCNGCKYVIMDMNKWKLLCDDDSREENSKAIIVIGNKIKFPDGTFGNKKEVPLIYANTGSDLDEEIEIEDAIGKLVRQYLFDLYSKRIAEDKTNNSNSNN